MTHALLKRLLLVAGRVPRYLPVGYPSPQHDVRVTLDGLDTPHDVTHTHVMIALRPLTVALTPPPGVPSDALARQALSLRLSPWTAPETTLGVVELRHTEAIETTGPTLHLFQQRGSLNACMPAAANTVFAVYHRWGDWKRRHQRNTPMEPHDLRAVGVLYICPRPVVLVTVQHGAASNLFPMDLIGQTDGPHFLLGLRNTSPSIRLIEESRRLAVSDAPLEFTARAFKLGEHHAKERIDWSALPFETGPSAGHGLPVPREALRVRDVQVRQVHVVGSHTLFVTDVVHDERRRDGLQMCFIAGPYYRRLALRGLEPPSAP
ncbi:MAG TPA: flavin reductase [Gemmatimonadales bacterium]|nr:flavin reductase [Gemmatimonadales bacterium]